MVVPAEIYAVDQLVKKPLTSVYSQLTRIDSSFSLGDVMETPLAMKTSRVFHDLTSDFDQPQDWVARLVSDGLEECLESPDGIELRRIVSPEFTLVTARLEGARGLSAERFDRGVQATYATIFDAAGPRSLVRMWNFIPGILDPVDHVDQRYKVFNAARFRSFSEWYGGVDHFRQKIPTASGTGTRGDDFVVHALATANPAEAIENPRQCSSYHYSSKYGPLPPCFARAMRVECASSRSVRLLVGGTASIRGESTCHKDELGPQLEETFKNLAEIAASGIVKMDSSVPSERRRQLSMARYRQLRVYCPHREDFGFVSSRLQLEFKHLEELELVQSDLCREGLLVEIEGWADVSP